MKTDYQLTEDDKIVLRAARDYVKPGKSGRIAWRRAVQEHPDWKQALSYQYDPPDRPKRGNDRLRVLEKLGFKAEGFVAKAADQPAASAKLTEEELRADEQIVLTIIKEYPVMGNHYSSRWKRAVADHPEWRQHLQRDAQDKKFSRAQAAWQRLNAKGRLPGKPGTPKKKTEATAAEVNGAVSRETLADSGPRLLEAIVEHCHFCARCGANLEVNIRTAAMQAKLSTHV